MDMDRIIELSLCVAIAGLIASLWATRSEVKWLKEILFQHMNDISTYEVKLMTMIEEAKKLKERNDS